MELLILILVLVALLVTITIQNVEGKSPEVNMGTTILAVRYRDGVVVGADTRTSVSGYVSNRIATKISFVLEADFGLYALKPSSQMQMRSTYFKPDDKDTHDNDKSTNMEGSVMRKKDDKLENFSSTCCICRSGSAADTQYLADIVRNQLLRRKILNSRSSSVVEAANLLKNYSCNDNISASLICAGYDHILDQGLIYSIDLGGTMIEQKGWACNGSGSGYILGLIDDCYPKREDSLWDEGEAVAFVKRSIGLAMERDGSSGGVVRIFVINRHGKKGIIHIPEFNLARQEQNTLKESNLSKFALPKR